MSFSLSRIGQIAMAVADLDRAEAFYEGTLGLRKLYRYGDLTFFDCAGVRLLLEKAHKPENVNDASTLYFSLRRYHARRQRAAAARRQLQPAAASDRENGRSRPLDGVF